MHHETPLIGTIVVGLVVAFIFGALAQRLRVSPVAGYLLAGIAVGPFTPGFVADRELALELAELGVILLMFGVGLHFSLRDLLSVRRKSTRLNPVTNAHLVCRLLLAKNKIYHNRSTQQ